MLARNKIDNILREIDGFQNEQQNITNQINIMKEKGPLIISNLDIKNNNNSNNNPNININRNINNIMNYYKTQIILILLIIIKIHILIVILIIL